jgi:hypothetical protein
MPFEVRLLEPAEAKLATLDWLLQREVLDHLDLLADSPTQLSGPSYFPWPPEYQMYQFRVLHEGNTHRFVVLFRYGADEQTIYVYKLGHIDLGPVTPLE